MTDLLAGQGDEAADVLAPAVLAALMADNPHLRWADFLEHGYVIVDVTPARTQTDWYAIPDILTPNTDEEFLAAWGTDDGANRMTEGTSTANKDAAPAVPGGEPPPCHHAAGAAGPPTEAVGPQPLPQLPRTGAGDALPVALALAAAGAIALRARRGEGAAPPDRG